MTNEKKASEILERAIGETIIAGAELADASYGEGASALTRFANNVIHQNVANESRWLRVRAVIGKRQGVVSTALLTDEAIKTAAKRAVKIAQVLPEDPDLIPLPKSPRAKQVGIYDEALAKASPALRAEKVREIIKIIEGGGAVASGSLATGQGCRAMATSSGTFQFDCSTHLDLNIVAMKGSGSGTATFASEKLEEVDVAERAKFALNKCLTSENPGEIEPGEYEVVLEPIATLELISFLNWLGFSAQKMQEGRSCLQGKLGQKVCSNLITIVDDPFDPAGMPSGYDGEGLPKQCVDLIVNGVLKNLVYDLKTAAKEGKKSTGHGGAPPNPWGPYAGNLIMSPGTKSQDEMVKSVKNGLLVSYFHYTNVSESSDATITGMTRYGLYEIQDGRIVRPLKNLRFTESVLRAFSNTIAVSKERQRFGGIVVPALQVKNFRFTGKSDH